MKFTRQIPKTNYLKPSTERKLELLSATNKINAMRLLKDANENAPSCFYRRKDSDNSVEKEKPKATFVGKSVPKFKVQKMLARSAAYPNFIIFFVTLFKFLLCLNRFEIKLLLHLSCI